MNHRLPLFCIFAVAICLCSNPLSAAVVRVDLLGGIGDFEYSGDTAWHSGYTGADYNFETQSGWTSEKSPAGWRWGWDPATPDDSVAVGWVRRTGPYVRPKDHTAYRIVPSGTPSGNCQYFCLKRVVGDRVYARLETHVKLRDEVPSDIHTGDTVTFRIDSIRMSGYDTIPAGTKLEYKIGFASGGEKTIEASADAFSAEVSWTVPPNVGKLVIPYISIVASGPLATAQPGVYVDGAHLYVKRASNPSAYATWEVPVVVTKGVKTVIDRPGWTSSPYDIYAVAKNCDGVVLGEADGAFAARLKYLNPNLKTYMYQIYTCLDIRDARGIDPWYSASPTQMSWVRRNNRTGWLFPNGKGMYGFVNERQFPHSYYMHIADSAFEAYWVADVKAKALRWRHQGVFMDSVNTLTQRTSAGKTEIPQRDPHEVQKFLHGTVPTLKAAGLDVMVNVGGSVMSEASSAVFLNPNWRPNAPHSTADYSSNTRSNTPDIVFLEWGFIRPGKDRNSYPTAYWLKCLESMDVLKGWNTSADGRAVPRQDQIHYSVEIEGIDRADDPAAGVDGWMQYGLASYLLGQNEWTSFSWAVQNHPTEGIDYSGTQKLGAPVGERVSIASDPCLVYRRYKTKDGGTAVVVVNANPDPRVYTVESNATDESGGRLAEGAKVTLKPHSGRIFTLTGPTR